MSKILEGLKYSESHEWVKVEGDVAVIGVSDFAQKEMGDITYVDMPDVDDEVSAGEEFGALESVKASSELISPVSGKVVEVNGELEDAPEKVNEDRRLDHQGGDVRRFRAGRPQGCGRLQGPDWRVRWPGFLICPRPGPMWRPCSGASA